MNRNDFQSLAELHLRHAKSLLDAGLYSGAYYMCGYAVECAWKACICARTNQYDFWPHPKEAGKAWSHDFDNLIEAAQREQEFKAARCADRALDINWGTVGNRTEASRYEPRGRKEAEDLLAAVSDVDHGVLSCIKRFW